MDSLIKLAKIWRIISTTLAVSLLVNPKFYIRLVNGFENEAMRFLYFFTVMIIGTVSVAFMNQWKMDQRGLITFLGWGSCVKGAVGILMPDLTMKIIKRINLSPYWVYWSGGVLFAVGLYLLFIGFGG